MKTSLIVTAMIATYALYKMIRVTKHAFDDPSAKDFEFSVISAVNQEFGPISIPQELKLKAIIYSWRKFTEGHKTSFNQFAYIFATAWWESNQLRTLTEIRAKQGTKLRSIQDKYWHTGYYGRGFVQITWPDNYKRLQNIINAPIFEDPSLAEHPTVAAEIIVKGMMLGAFTGVPLRKYVNEYKTDFYNARRVVNGTDKADTIKGLAQRFLNQFQTV